MKTKNDFKEVELLPLEALEKMKEELILVRGGNSSAEVDGGPSECKNCDCC